MVYVSNCYPFYPSLIFEGKNRAYTSTQEKHDSDKHSNLLDPFITYKENKVDVNRAPGFITLHFFVTYR